MNIFDLLLAVIFFSAIAYYACKLHKKRAGNRAETAKTGAPDMPDIMPPHSTAQTATATTTMAVKFCKFVPVKLTGIPSGLPFGETYDPSDFNKSLMAAGYDVNEEIKTLSSTGFTVLAVTPLLLCYDMMVLCITAGKQQP